MYNFAWIEKNNLLKLVNEPQANFPGQAPRPVYWEELDILGFNQYYKYPKSDQPLLWACGRAYYYKGEKIASAKGGDIYAKPEIEVIRVCSFDTRRG